MNDYVCIPGAASPWGIIENTVPIAEGIISVSTPSHGGIYLSPGRVLELPAAIRAYRSKYHNGSPNWFEEDCEVVMVISAFPQFFEGTDTETVAAMLQAYYPFAVRAPSFSERLAKDLAQFQGGVAS